MSSTNLSFEADVRPWTNHELYELCMFDTNSKRLPQIASELGRSSEECHARLSELLVYANDHGMTMTQLAERYSWHSTQNDTATATATTIDVDKFVEHMNQATASLLKAAQAIKSQTASSGVQGSGPQSINSPTTNAANDQGHEFCNDPSPVAPTNQQGQPLPSAWQQQLADFRNRSRHTCDIFKKASALSGVVKVLRPDIYFGEIDCVTISTLEHRYRYHPDKWNLIQAQFYNVTGRKIMPGTLEIKFNEF